MRRAAIFVMGIGIVFLLAAFSHLCASDRGLKTVTVEISQGERIELYKDTYALVIGNSNYSNGWDPIPGAIRDVREVTAALKKHGFSVTLKTDLSKDKFSRALNEFALKYGREKDNRLLFYYAGHGFTQQMAAGEELGYLVMVNAPLPEADLIGFSLSSVDMQALITQAKIIRARHVLFMFDSCFSGSIINMRERVVPRSISDSVKYPVRQFITAGRANEPVPDQSVFKQAFLDLLEGRDAEPIPDYYITGEELGLYLKTKVPLYYPGQHPQYGKIKDPRLDKGDFVFALKPPEPVRPPQPPPSKLEAEKKRLAAETEQIERERQELAQLKLELEKQKLETERRRLEMEKQAIEENKRKEKQKLAVISKKSIDSEGKKPASEPPYSVAIFPWLLKNEATDQLEFTLARIIGNIDKSYYLNLAASFYQMDSLAQEREMDGLSKWRVIDSGVINSGHIDQLWQKTSSFQNKKPYVKLVQQIGKKIKVDAVLMVYFDVRRGGMLAIGVERIVIYLIDVKSGKLVSVKNMQPLSIHHAYFRDELDSYLTKVINDYVDFKY